MIAKLRGIVDSLGLDWVIIDVNGVGYLISCSGRTLSRLQQGSEGTLLVETKMYEDRIQLYGFSDVGERDWFRMLQTVQGVGGKVALSILTVLPPDGLVQAIAAGDRTALSRADGVGPKLATRLISELKDKVGGLALGAGVAASMVSTGSSVASVKSPTNDAVSALVNLGYGRSEAFGAVAKAAKDLGDGATVDALIRTGLKELSQ